MNIKDYIIKEAEKIGIDIIGFTGVKPFENMKKLLKERRDKGYETEFEENDIELRYNPKKVMPNSKSIIVIGVSYNLHYKSSKKFNARGRLSKSSWGRDYHTVLKNKLEELADAIKKVKEFDYKIFVDTGPLIDREIAKRAGIGWYGKNCSIINDKYGSFIFIGYMITNLDLEENSPLEEKCKTCDLCIRACPTNALEENYKINATRCISYLTQTKRKIPYDLRDKMGIKIYGCDTCQLVCPKNKGVNKGNCESFLPEKTRGYIEIEELFNLSNKEFKKKYGHMAGSWRGKNVLKRNCIIAIGNMKDKTYLDLLKQTLKDPSPMIREYTAWALLKIEPNEGKKVIKEHLKIEKDDNVKNEMKKLLEYFEGGIIENRYNV
ncbi:tRNA epoxyqueuosine(34) reductase QueG [Thermohalobacter berrensis]|uniref:tRNA epoxyqueuosine(34) reductase QueG n=1 Tax=Thermohalobacter berrensis TaxID=99594 RepID=A0A419SV38_9FIRM|nr:tRNA epoxyqueuosine(34) reductase QueG [Thermohalobacter berrensis]RKD29075.1 tRNA epoxyqueuosine(34) reductase QueG [Thermohalobacter berrensis]